LYGLQAPTGSVMYCPDLPMYPDGIQHPLTFTALTEDLENVSVNTDSDGVSGGDGILMIDAEYGLITCMLDAPAAYETAAFTYRSKEYASYNESFEFDLIDGVDTRPLPLTGKIPIFHPGDKIVIRNNSTGVEDMNLVTGVTRNPDGSGNIALAAELIHDYTIPSADNVLMACTVNQHGDLTSDVTVIFTQQSWDGSSWADTQSGSPASGAYNYADYPITCKNLGAVTERWQIQITRLSPLEGSIRGQHYGVIAVNVPLDSLVSPSNPMISGAKYFSVMAGGWGAGWQVGNIMRFNTVGAAHPDWVVRVINVGASDSVNDMGHLMIRGDVPLGAGDVIAAVTARAATIADGAVTGIVDETGNVSALAAGAAAGAVTGVVDATGAATAESLTVTPGAITGTVS
jgi:hypothetical protein